jgi:hypothetical protein
MNVTFIHRRTICRCSRIGHIGAELSVGARAGVGGELVNGGVAVFVTTLPPFPGYATISGTS